MTTWTAEVAATRRDLWAQWRRARWHHPEWTLAAVAVAAWAALFASAAHSGHTVSAAPAHTHVRVAGGVPDPSISAAHWSLMVVAMMLPSVLPAARLIGLTGKWGRRQRGPGLFAIAYLGVWTGAGLLAMALLHHGAPDAHGRWMLTTALLLAALWELSPWKVRFLRACHRYPPIAPDGWRADLGCLTRGARNSLSCLGSCWAMMSAMLVIGHTHALWLMMPATAVILYQKSGTPTRVVRPVAVGLVAAAAVVALW